MTYFVNILYNKHVEFEKYDTHYLYTIIIYDHCVFVFNTQYDCNAQFRLEYNHDLHQ